MIGEFLTPWLMLLGSPARLMIVGQLLTAVVSLAYLVPRLVAWQMVAAAGARGLGIGVAIVVSAALGESLQRAIDEMSNEQFQLLLRSPAERIADALGDAVPDVPDDELLDLISDLGGRDFGVLRHPSALSWIGSIFGVKAYPLGVCDFGQSGLPHELHAHFAIDADSICHAAYVALGAGGGATLTASAL